MPARPASAAAWEDLNLLADDMCRITVGVGSAYRALKAGHRGAVVRQMCVLPFDSSAPQPTPNPIF